MVSIGPHGAVPVAVDFTVAVQKALGKLGTDVQLFRLLPRELLASKVSVTCRLLVDRFL